MTERPKILVVDDSAAMRQLLSFALRRVGNVEIVEARDGIEGLKAARQGDVRVALVDINMPNMDGLMMIRHIRKDPRLAKLPVIIITTEGEEDKKNIAENLGVSHYITKPINQSQVVDTVKTALQIK